MSCDTFRPHGYRVLSGAVAAPLAAILLLAVFVIFPPRRTSLLFVQLPPSRHPSFIPVALVERSPRIGLATGGRICFDGQAIPMELLPALLRPTSNHEQQVVVIRADRRISWGELKVVLMVLRRTGCRRVFLLTTLVGRSGWPLPGTPAMSFGKSRQEASHG